MTARTLTDEQRKNWLDDGYFLVRDALSAAEIESLSAAVERGWDAYRGAHPAANHAKGVEVTTAMEQGDEFRRLIAQPTTFPLVVDLLGRHIQLYISVFTVRPPNPSARGFIHTDGGQALQSIRVTDDSHPLQAKVHYFLTDLPEEDHGNFAVVPGSHRRAASWEEGYEPAPSEIEGIRQITARAGDAVVFSHQLWHGAVPNTSQNTRRTVTFGYSQLFMRPADYVTPSDALLARASPLERRLLGDLGPLDDAPEGTAYFSPEAQNAGRYYYSPKDQHRLIHGRN